MFFLRLPARQLHIIDIGHRATVIGETDHVHAGLEPDAHVYILPALGGSYLHGLRGARADREVDRPLLRTQATQREAVFPALAAVDIPPLQVPSCLKARVFAGGGK